MSSVRIVHARLEPIVSLYAYSVWPERTLPMSGDLVVVNVVPDDPSTPEISFRIQDRVYYVNRDHFDLYALSNEELRRFKRVPFDHDQKIMLERQYAICQEWYGQYQSMLGYHIASVQKNGPEHGGLGKAIRLYGGGK